MTLQLALLAAIILFGYTVGTSIGFGGSIISATLAALFLPIDFIVPVLVPLNVITTAYLAIRHRRFIQKQILLRQILPYAGLTLPLGLAMFLLIHTEGLRWALGLFVLGLSVWELFRMFRAKQPDALGPLAKHRGILLLGAGGLVQGMWATGGPLIAYWAGRSITGKGDFRATLAALWLVLNSVLLIAHFIFGKLTFDTARTDLILLPFLIIAIALAEWLHARMPERFFRTAIYVVLAFSGVALILR